MEDFYNKHYIRIREDGCIVDGFSDAFRQPADTDICINEHGGYQFRLWPDGVENPMLTDVYGIPLYKWDGSYPVERSQEEIEADRAALPTPAPEPTGAEKIAALEKQVAEQQAVINALLGG